MVDKNFLNKSMDKKCDPAEPIRSYLVKILSQQSSDAGFLKRGINREDEKEMAIGFTDFREGFDHAVRTVYNTLCLLDIYADENKSPEMRQLYGLKIGLEEYLFPNKNK